MEEEEEATETDWAVVFHGHFVFKHSESAARFSKSAYNMLKNLAMQFAGTETFQGQLDCRAGMNDSEVLNMLFEEPKKRSL